MKKKAIIASMIVAVLILLGVYYFPMPLNRILGDGKPIILSQVNITFQDGKPSIEYINYDIVSNTNEYNEIKEQFSLYTYRRSLNSLFLSSDNNHLNSNSNDIYNIFVYQDSQKNLIDTITLDGTGKIIVNGHSYQMEI